MVGRILAEAEGGREGEKEGGSDLLKMILEMLEYKGWNADEGEMPNLWEALAKNKVK